jgi:hypothetical protein
MIVLNHFGKCNFANNVINHANDLVVWQLCMSMQLVIKQC